MTRPTQRQQYATATRTWPDSVYSLPQNPVWNVPDSIGEVQGEITTRGPWHQITGYRALAYSWDERDTEHYGDYVKTVRIYGCRQLTNAHESGYDLEGKVSIGGKTYRGFTSSLMFQRPDGSLVSVAAIHVCIPEVSHA